MLINLKAGKHQNGETFLSREKTAAHRHLPLEPKVTVKKSQVKWKTGKCESTTVVRLCKRTDDRPE